MELAEILSSALCDVRELPNENAATAALARSALRGGARVIWTAKSIWPQLSACRRETSWVETKAYDLSWSCSEAANRPDVLCQVKMGTKLQEDQEFLLYLGDLAFAALDHAVAGIHPITVAVVPRSRNTRFWSRICPDAGEITLTLDPRTASEGQARGVEWINQETGEIRPYARSQYQKIFGAGTNAKFVGLFRRPGRFVVRARAERHVSGDFVVYCHQVTEGAFTGPGDLLTWWP